MVPKAAWQSVANVTLRRLVALASFCFLAAPPPASAGVSCSCVDPNPACCPHAVGTFYVIVFLNEAEGDPTDFIDQVKADPLLNEELGYPSDARLAVMLRPLPPGFTPEPGSPRELLARYIDLQYPPGIKSNEVLELLTVDPRFGYVALVTAEDKLSGPPNDPYYLPPLPPQDPHIHQQWAFEQLHFEDAWEITTGHAFIGVSDTGIEVPDPVSGSTQHPDLIGNYRPQHSYDYRCCDEDPREEPFFGGLGHGTHVAGLLAATTNNLLGVAGGCQTCSLQVASGLVEGNQASAFQWMTGNGAQVLNMSGKQATGASTCVNTPMRPLCPLLALLVQRDVALVASSGNNRSIVDFPANDPRTIAVGGTDENGALWDRYPECPYCQPNCGPNPTDQRECGSNSGPAQDFVAPAQHVLSTFFTGGVWNTLVGCTDNDFGPQGYDYCTGTSMSAPFVTDAVAMVRSTNPLLSVAASKQALIDTTGQVGHNNTFGYGIPNVGAALREVLGTTGGNPGSMVKSRLTPLFALYSPLSPTGADFLYTTVPQVAAGAVLGELHTPPTGENMVAYASAAVGDPVAGYPAFPIDSGMQGPEPRASAYIFTTEHNPFDPSTPLLPLYRLSFVEDCDVRSHAYAVQMTGNGGVDYFTQTDWCVDPGAQNFRLDGIEGYIFPSCPAGFTCNNAQDPAQPQCLHRRHSSVDKGWALILQRELGLPPYTTYTEIPVPSCLGYVFPNDDSDGDGLIDGFEYVLATDPSDANSDLDALSDSAEYPLIALPTGDPLYPTQVTCPIIRYDGFTGSLVNRWNGVGIAGNGSLSVPQDAWSSNPGEYGECPINEPVEFGYLQADVQGGAGDQAYLIDTNPAAEQVYRVGFWLNLDHAVMAANDNLMIFLARDVNPTPKNVFYLVLGKEQGDYFVWAVVYRNDGTTVTTRKVRVGVDPTALEVEWWANGARGAQLGGLRIRYNGEVAASTFLVNNGNLQVDTVMLGAVTGVDAGTSGSFAFNTFKSFSS